MEETPLYNEVNFLTDDDQLWGESLCSAIKTEFDLIRAWQGMARTFGYEARSVLDNFIALSLRKMLCDKNSPILKLCPDFKMPPLTGTKFNCPGEDDSMKLVEIWTYIGVRPEAEWIPVNKWLGETIAWIEKNEDNIPDAYSDRFYFLLAGKLSKTNFAEFFECEIDGKGKIWRVKDPIRNKRKVYEILKANGYYDLTIKTFIKHIADKNGAHMDDKKSVWIRMANSSNESSISAISAFATQMIYAATKQIDGLRDYYPVQPMMEIITGESK